MTITAGQDVATCPQNDGDRSGQVKLPTCPRPPLPIGGTGGGTADRSRQINLDDTLELIDQALTWDDLERRLGFSAKSIDKALRRHGHNALAQKVTARSQLNPERTGRGTTGLVLTRAKATTTHSLKLCDTCPGPNGHTPTCEAIRAAWADLKGTP